MVRFELKKMLGKTGGKIALLLLAAIVVTCSWLAVNVDYYDEQGNQQPGFAAARKLRSMQKEWSGVLDEEMLREVIAENQRIASHPDYLSQNIQKSNAVYSMRQGIQEIRQLLNFSFAENFRSYDYYRADSLTPDQAPYFYENRIRLLKEWLDSDDAKDRYTQSEKDFLIQQYESLETPFRVDYVMGWKKVGELSSAVTMLGVIVLGYLLSGLFAGEFQLKSDALFFSSFQGRRKAVAAKVKAGFLLVTIVYWVMWLTYSGFVLAYLGADGGDTPIQSTWECWKSFYNINQWQKYLLMTLGGYVGFLSISAMTMWVSAATKSSILAAMIPWVLIFIPSFVQDIHFLDDVMALFPDRLLNVNAGVEYFELFELFGKVVGAIPLQFAIYIPATLLLIPIIYQTYRKKQLG